MESPGPPEAAHGGPARQLPHFEQVVFGVAIDQFVVGVDTDDGGSPIDFEGQRALAVVDSSSLDQDYVVGRELGGGGVPDEDSDLHRQIEASTGLGAIGLGVELGGLDLDLDREASRWKLADLGLRHLEIVEGDALEEIFDQPVVLGPRLVLEQAEEVGRRGIGGGAKGPQLDESAERGVYDPTSHLVAESHHRQRAFAVVDVRLRLDTKEG